MSATGYERQGNDIRTRWLLQQATWATESSTPVIFDNYDEDDSDVPLAKQSRAPWISVTILEGAEEQVCFGGVQQRWRNTGVLVNDVYVPKGFGPARGDRICNYIANDWRGVSLRNMTFRGPAVVRQGSPDGKWYMMTVEIPFYRDDFHSHTSYPATEGNVAIEHTLAVPDSSIFAVGDWITVDSGSIVDAISDGTQTMRVVRPITQIPNGAEITVATGGSVTFLSHGYTVGSTLYLSQTVDGDVTETEYASGWNKPVAFVLDDDTLDLIDEEPWLA